MGYSSATSRDWSDVSFEVGRQTLKEWRDSNARRSEEVVELWDHVISRCPSQLGDEQWVVYEQVCVAALDCSRLDLSNECTKALDRRFPNSNRVRKLHGMQFEAQEDYESAYEVYSGLIEADPTNNSFRKRKIALLLAERRRLDAIKELNEYLKIFLNDSEAWLQLSELFLAEGDLAKAAHCIEECVLAAPLNTLYLRRLGDIRYTQGGVENMELAKAYYQQASKLNPADLRSLYGIVLCCNYLSNHSKGSTSEKKKEVTVAGGTAADLVIERYQQVDASENPEVQCLADAVQQMKTGLMTGK